MSDQKRNDKVRIILLVVIGLLSVYSVVVWVLNYVTLQQAVTVNETVIEGQAKNFRTVKTSLDVANQKVADLTTELQTANAELSLTRNELSSVQSLNDQLKAGIEVLEHYKSRAAAKGEALGSMINAFKRKNKQLDADLQSVRKELANFQPDIADNKEAREKIVRFKDQIRLVKKNMVALKEQALVMKKAAQEQRDRLEILYGNNGYLMKDGRDQSLKRQGTQVDIKVEFK